jgi:hypothetical protein
MNVDSIESRVRTNTLCLVGALSGLLAVGCGAQSSAEPTEPGAANGPKLAAPTVKPSTLTERPSVLLASVDVSGTHRIELREMSDVHALAVVEHLNADADRATGSLIKGYDPRRRTTADLYRSLLQSLPVHDQDAEAAQLAKLSDFDARSGAGKQSAVVPTDHGVGAASQALNDFFPDQDPSWFTQNFCWQNNGRSGENTCVSNLEDTYFQTPTHETEYTQGVLFNECEATDVNCAATPMLALMEQDCGSVFSVCTETPVVQRITAGPRQVVTSDFWTFSDEIDIAGGAWADSEESGWGSQYAISVAFD